VTRRLKGRDVKCGVTASNAGGSANALSKALHVG
jgi:hypothetical protein